MTAPRPSRVSPEGVRPLGVLRSVVLGAFLVACLLLAMPDVWRAAWVMANGIAGAILVAHVGMDRLAGYGLKHTSGFKDTHMQRA